ncbi:2977c166-803b-48d6-863f-f20bda72462b [Thermothielavioides terrestris]|uniref:2977c166-803b-48d6-863f-f20bda72462b n=1 Tax=Thermothielavioides terrestris TaxID=2587410 RepID=A0A3S4B8B8_9PEZI|nr:2977c166-803b-48d6-863f-f20bda72462b [Thermothielavioides terrestris]
MATRRNEIVVVTGASSGIGAHIVHGLLARNRCAIVVIICVALLAWTLPASALGANPRYYPTGPSQLDAIRALSALSRAVFKFICTPMVRGNLSQPQFLAPILHLKTAAGGDRIGLGPIELRFTTYWGVAQSRVLYVLNPEITDADGPVCRGKPSSYVEGESIRSHLVDVRVGVPLYMDIQTTDVKICPPTEGIYVEIWMVPLAQDVATLATRATSTRLFYWVLRREGDQVVTINPKLSGFSQMFPVA